MAIQHKYVESGSLKLHIAEMGSGPKAVLFLHGFPEIWYTWRHQMKAVAEAGYRAIAMDCRGYGLSDQPPHPEKSTYIEFAQDVIAVLDSLSINKAFLAGRDAGSIVLSVVAVLHPERFHAFITLDVPFALPGVGSFQKGLLPKGFYISRWQEPGRAEVDFGRFDVKTVIKKIYVMFCWSELQIAKDDQEIMDLVPSDAPLPPWFSEDDLSVYADLYDKSGFQTALQVPYRTLDISIGVENPNVKIPAMHIMGEKDYVFKFPGMEEYLRGGKIKELVPDTEVVFMPEGNHFLHEQLPEEVNQLIVSFLDKQCVQ